MCRRYIKKYSCSHQHLVRFGEPCRKTQARIRRGELPRSDECRPVPTEPDEHTRMKCHECHKAWKKDQPQYFDDMWKTYVTPLAASHPDLKEWLQQLRKDQRSESRATLEHLEKNQQDEEGNFLYEAYAISVNNIITNMSAYVTGIIDSRSKTAAQVPQGGQSSDGSSCPGSCSDSCSGSSCPGSYKSGGSGKASSSGKHGKSGSKSGGSRGHGQGAGSSSKGKNSGSSYGKSGGSSSRSHAHGRGSGGY